MAAGVGVCDGEAVSASATQSWPGRSSDASCGAGAWAGCGWAISGSSDARLGISGSDSSSVGRDIVGVVDAADLCVRRTLRRPGGTSAAADAEAEKDEEAMSPEAADGPTECDGDGDALLGDECGRDRFLAAAADDDEAAPLASILSAPRPAVSGFPRARLGSLGPAAPEPLAATGGSPGELEDAADVCDELAAPLELSPALDADADDRAASASSISSPNWANDRLLNGAVAPSASSRRRASAVAMSRRRAKTV